MFRRLFKKKPKKVLTLAAREKVAIVKIRIAELRSVENDNYTRKLNALGWARLRKAEQALENLLEDPRNWQLESDQDLEIVTKRLDSLKDGKNHLSYEKETAEAMSWDEESFFVMSS